MIRTNQFRVTACAERNNYFITWRIARGISTRLAFNYDLNMMETFGMGTQIQFDLGVMQ